MQSTQCKLTFIYFLPSVNLKFNKCELQSRGRKKKTNNGIEFIKVWIRICFFISIWNLRSNTFSPYDTCGISFSVGFVGLFTYMTLKKRKYILLKYTHESQSRGSSPLCTLVGFVDVQHCQWFLQKRISWNCTFSY